MINREQYMEQIVPFIDKPFVKVITGIRRSGKSVVLRLIRDELLRRGVREERIIYLNFESFQWIDLKEAKALYAYIRGQAGDAGKYYILLDEIQEVDGWEKVVNSLLVDGRSHRSWILPRAQYKKDSPGQEKNYGRICRKVRHGHEIRRYEKQYPGNTRFYS